jgi:hypothetical protein
LRQHDAGTSSGCLCAGMRVEVGVRCSGQTDGNGDVARAAWTRTLYGALSPAMYYRLRGNFGCARGARCSIYDGLRHDARCDTWRRTYITPSWDGTCPLSRSA